MNYGSRSVYVPQAGLPSKSDISLGKEEGLDGKATYHPGSEKIRENRTAKYFCISS
jgi:hypothetical protein